MTYVLYIDDVRDPDPVVCGIDLPLIIARSSTEAFRLITDLGLPQVFSFDHDLGGEDTTMTFLRRLEHETDLIQDCDCPAYRVHSANPVGTLNIISFMESWRKSRQS